MRSRRGAARSVAAPFPPRHALPPLRRRVGGRARSRVPGRPPGSCPRRSGARRAVCAQGFLSAASGRPCAPLCVSPAAPPLPLLARVSGALRGVLAPLRLGLALAAGGVAGAPLPRPLRGFARSRSPGGGSCRGCRRGLWLLRRPPRGWGWCCRRCGGGAAAPSCSASGAGAARSVVLGACPPLLRAALRVRGLSCTFRARFPADALRCLSRICRLALSRMLFRD